MLSYTLSNTGNVSPEAVACLTRGIANDSHDIFFATKIRKN